MRCYAAVSEVVSFDLEIVAISVDDFIHTAAPFG